MVSAAALAGGGGRGLTLAPRELPPGVVAHMDFPRDGRLRWLRWLDGVDVLAPSGTPAVHALLTPLPDGTDARILPTLADVATAYEGTSAHRVHVGSLPGLRLGAVFHDGVHVGDLGMQASGRLGFGHSDDALMVRANAENPAEAPSWWTRAWTVLPMRRYPLGHFSSAFCVQFAAPGLHLLVPCSELFRVLCAPETRLANALLSGPWATVAGMVTNEAWNDRSGGTWTVGLRSGLTARSALPVAAYQLTVWGRQVASSMRAPPMAGRLQSHLRAAVPYRFERIGLEGEGVPLLDVDGLRRFLMLRLASVAFPEGILDLPGVRYRLDNFNIARLPVDGDDREPPYTKVVPVAGPDPATGKLGATPDYPPSVASEPTVVRHPAPEITGLPPLDRLELEPPRPAEARRRRFIRREPVPLASAGVPRRGGGDVAGLAHSEEKVAREPAPGFAKLTSALDELGTAGSIASWMPAVPDDAPWAFVGGLEAWLLPSEVEGERRGFGWLEPGLARACLVAEVEIGAGRVVHLLELQRRRPAAEQSKSKKGFKLALLEIGSDELERVVSTLLQGVVVGEGKWPDTAVAGRFAPLRHCYKPVDDLVPAERVSAAWLGRAIAKFLRRG